MSTESTKTIKGRISNKHGTEADWYAAGTAATPFCPLEGELIIYDPDAIYEHPRTKYGAKDARGNLIPVHLLPWASGCDETVGLEFELSQDKSYFICSGIGSFRGGELIIPRGHCGLPVKEIGDNAFSEIGSDEDPQLQFSEITKVIIPYGIEIIGKWAFSLGYYFINGGITIPNSVHTLKESAFWAAQYDYIYIPKSVITNDSWLFGDGMGIELKKVYCEYFENELPNTWHSSWNMENVPVVWGATKDILKLNEKIGDTTALETESKEIVGAINELNDKIGEGSFEIVTTTGTGDAYEATVAGITELKAGVSFVMIPHVTSISVTPTLNVNGLGAKYINRYATDGQTITWPSKYNFFRTNKPYRIIYEGTRWILEDYTRPNAEDISGIVPVANGGVPSTNVDNAGKVLTTNASGTPEWQTPSGGGEIDTSQLQTKTDESLETDDKSVVGAINELNEKSLANAENISVAGDIEGCDSYGIWWDASFYVTKDEGNTEIADIPAHTRLPLVAGDNVTFDVVNSDMGPVVKINATGGTPQTSITYSELKALRDNSELIPGMLYRITDYQCTTTQENTRAMNNQFDIIVQALDVNKLSENASAIQHEGDEYFADVNLAAWELKYSLDNNANRFWWADEEKGKGIIYYMKDENNNECPYDFKNIQFKRYRVVECEEVPNYVGQYIATQDDLDIDVPDEIEWDADDFIWCYTFTIVLEGVITDYSMFREELLVENNNVKAYSQYDRQMLNNNVFISPHGFEAEDDSHFFGNNIIDGVYNTISVDYYIRENSIIGICNTFSSSSVEDAHIEGSHNLFGGYVYNIILPKCDLNIFAGFATELSFGPGCTYNYFGHITESSLGCGCTNIRFCYPDYTPQHYLRRLVVGNGCSRVKLINNEEGKWSNYVQDITISSGIQQKELQVSRNAAPVVFEAANTTHIILD